MGLFDKIRGEFIDIIEWTDDSNDTMVYRFERYDNEIKYMTTSLKADIEANVGTILDIKEQLIDINALKINFSTQGTDLERNK